MRPWPMEGPDVRSWEGEFLAFRYGSQ